ncbi:hypothetical protein RhiirA1_403305 [Rhizophagus irregularis]|uniref:Uncharacterized protein n=1 Tax=Rhizophagus irregularis TaxID=588596 RepID=A0A2I1FF48_9GLOM|nr:hypothetical protein RhiirA1_403305 [Rhizophagus irregularis]PKY33015.1 hypothetical protein RhiirB3_394465 [Rhizophagus irregularis]CAB4490957.1 unnamed protein product [Rhizophagus irregularis]
MMTNNNIRVTPKTKKKKKGKPFNTSFKNIQNNNVTYKQDTNIRPLQKEQNEHSPNNNISEINAFNLVFMGHNINGLGLDDFKLNILMDYCTNKRADIIGIVETNRDRKYGKFWNKQNAEYTSFWTNKDNKIKGSGMCIVINKKWEKYIRKINRIGTYYIEV